MLFKETFEILWNSCNEKMQANLINYSLQIIITSVCEKLSELGFTLINYTLIINCVF